MEILPDPRKIDPLALVSGEPAMVAAQGDGMGARGTVSSLFPVFLHLRTGDRSLPEKIAGLRGNARQVHSRLYSGAIPMDAARYISNWPDIAYIEAGRRARPLLDLSVPAVSADIVHQPSQRFPPPFDADGITGAGVYVGVVDSGLSGAHPDFRTGGEGSPLRVSRTYTSPQLPILNPPPSPDPLIDEDGHGTHVTGIAAGNGFSSGGTYTGMAPEAGILVGKTSFFTTDIINAVSDLLTFADNNSTPVAVNLSLGTVLGPHDGTSGFESAIGFYADGPAGSRRIIAVAAGNERDKEEHFQATVPPFGLTTATITFAGLSSTLVEIWADGDDRYTVTATMGSETVSVPSGFPGSSAGGRISISNAESRPPNGATFIDLFFLPGSSGATASIELRRTRNGGTGKVDGYIDELEGTFDTFVTTGTVTEPANADGVLAVGSFNTKTFTGDPASQGISSFSSLGPTRDGRTKPDLTAPGFVIYSARSLEAPDDNYYGIVPGTDNNYAILGGTSMSAPHVAGIAALVWESNPDLTGAQMRERLRRTADPPTDGSPVPNTTWGYGKVNALTAVTASVASITAPETSVPGLPVALTSENSSGPFGTTIMNYQWAAPGASLSSPNNASATLLANTPGDYTVSLIITAGGVTSASASKIIHVNTIPAAAISGPSSAEAGTPVSFSGTESSDPDGQTIAFRWVLVSRPEGSFATLLSAGGDNASMTPDVVGEYEVGLRVDDGLDNSALVTKLFTATPPPAPPSSGGGGCSIGNGTGGDAGGSPLATLLLLLVPLGVLSARKRRSRFLHRARVRAIGSQG
jgi:subtilisin family serine protease